MVQEEIGLANLTDLVAHCNQLISMNLLLLSELYGKTLNQSIFTLGNADIFELRLMRTVTITTLAILWHREST
jgi:hypothetical protein